MKNRILLWVFIVLLIVVIILWLYKKKYIYFDPITKFPKVSTESFKDRLIANTQYEWDLWNLPKPKKENNSAMQGTLKKYWEEGVGTKFPGYETPWSAVVVSYLMKKSGAGSDFPYSASHFTWIVKSIANAKLGRGKLRGYKIKDRKPEVGDLLAKPRQSGVTYSTKTWYKSHSDIIIEKGKGYVVVAGGNVSDTFKKKKIYLDSNGYVKSSDYMFIIKNMI